MSIPPSLPALPIAAEIRSDTRTDEADAERDERLRVAIADDFAVNRPTYQALADR